MRKIFVIPDVHGRTFWREAVYSEALKDENSEIIFLGDYLDPYPQEWPIGFDYQEYALEIFEEIVELKKKYPSKITLLLGNHDCGYVYSTYICDCRRDNKRANTIQKIFRENHELFNIACERTIGDKRYIFSHAGILNGWLKQCSSMILGENENTENIIEKLNQINQAALSEDTPGDTSFADDLAMYDWWRGGIPGRNGSIVWADVRDVDAKVDSLVPKGYHIFGHTRAPGNIIKTDKYAMVDCLETCVIDETGEIKKWEKAKTENDDNI